MVLEGRWELVDGLVSIHKEEVGSWARSFASSEVEGLEGNVAVDTVVDKAADMVGNSLADPNNDNLTWFSFFFFFLAVSLFCIVLIYGNKSLTGEWW